MSYRESYETGNSFRQEYLAGITGMLKNKQKEADEERRRFAGELAKNPEKYRKKLAHMLGWPLDERMKQIEGPGSISCEKQDTPSVKKYLVAQDGDVNIYRMQIEVMPDFWYYGILFLREDGKKHPLIIAQHGGDGTPERCSTLLETGSGVYNDMSRRILQYDANVFAPQMLLWDKNLYHITYNREHIDNMLRQCGGSITALETYCLMRTVDYFETQEYVDAGRIGMVGLSYGGMYTMFMTALDKRVKAAISCSFFCERYQEERSDWTYFNAGRTFQDAEIVMLARPRKIFLAMGERDKLFSADGSRREFERIKEVFPDYKEWTDITIFSGKHEFIKENGLLDRLFEELSKAN